MVFHVDLLDAPIKLIEVCVEGASSTNSLKEEHLNAAKIW